VKNFDKKRSLRESQKKVKWWVGYNLRREVTGESSEAFCCRQTMHSAARFHGSTIFHSSSLARSSCSILSLVSLVGQYLTLLYKLFLSVLFHIYSPFDLCGRRYRLYFPHTHTMKFCRVSYCKCNLCLFWKVIAALILLLSEGCYFN